MTLICPVCHEEFVLPRVDLRQSQQEAALIWAGVKRETVIVCEDCYRQTLILDAWERAGHMGERWLN